MTMQEFRQHFAAMKFVDKDDSGLTDERWRDFRDDPHRFFDRQATDAEREAIWAAQERVRSMIARIGLSQEP